MDSPCIRTAPISDDVLQKIFESDQDIYPAPLAYERLRSWVTGCPDLCICFHPAPQEESDPNPIGAIIVLPLLKRHWEDVLVGKLKEIDIELGMFAGEGEDDVGLHVFHIERFGADYRGTRFAEMALGIIGSMIAEKDWNVLGYSALTATPAGRAVFRRMGFVPTGYEELFFMGSDATGATADMISVYPEQTELQNFSGEFHSRSQMVVGYTDRTKQVAGFGKRWNVRGTFKGSGFGRI